MSDDQIYIALQNLPRDLPETFERILRRYARTKDQNLGGRIFRWVAIAKCPLTVYELREAIGIEPLQEAWDAKRFVNDIKKATACCGNLTYIEEEQQTIHFTHSSVKQYLASHDINSALGCYYVDLDQADAYAGTICVTYLNFSIFDSQVARSADKRRDMTRLPLLIAKESLPFGLSANKTALSLLRVRQGPSNSINRHFEEALAKSGSHCQEDAFNQYAFRPYAKRFWLEHTSQEKVLENRKLETLSRNLIEQAEWRGTLSDLPWTFEDLSKYNDNVFEWIVEKHHCLLAQLLTTCGTPLLEKNLSILINGAAVKGYTELLNISLKSEAISQEILDSALQLAAGEGHLAIVERLLQEKSEVNTASAEYWGTTALQAAAGGGHLAVVEKLLRAKANVNTEPAMIIGLTAL